MASHVYEVQVIVAYATELFLAIFLAIGVTLWEPVERKHDLPHAIHQTYIVFADAAVNFTISIQLASLIRISERILVFPRVA